MLRYTIIDNIKERLSTRMFVDTGMGDLPSGLQQTVSVNLISISAAQIEEWMDAHLQLLYELPLQTQHPILNAVAEKLIMADILVSVYEGSVAIGGDNGYISNLKQSALDLFQSLFIGTGITIIGATATPQNSPGQQQLQARFIPLPNETVKTSIGMGTDLWLQTETPQSYYIGDKKESENGITRSDRSRISIDFYEDRYTYNRGSYPV